MSEKSPENPESELKVQLEPESEKELIGIFRDELEEVIKARPKTFIDEEFGEMHPADGKFVRRLLIVPVADNDNEDEYLTIIRDDRARLKRNHYMRLEV